MRWGDFFCGFGSFFDLCFVHRRFELEVVGVFAMVAELPISGETELLADSIESGFEIFHGRPIECE